MPAAVPGKRRTPELGEARGLLARASLSPGADEEPRSQRERRQRREAASPREDEPDPGAGGPVARPKNARLLGRERGVRGCAAEPWKRLRVAPGHGATPATGQPLLQARTLGEEGDPGQEGPHRAVPAGKSRARVCGRGPLPLGLAGMRGVTRDSGRGRAGGRAWRRAALRRLLLRSGGRSGGGQGASPTGGASSPAAASLSSDARTKCFHRLLLKASRDPAAQTAVADGAAHGTDRTDGST